MKRILWTAGVMMAAAAGLGQAVVPQRGQTGAVGVGAAMGTGVGSDAQPVAVLLEQGVYQEETAGDLPAAAKTYNQIVSQATVTRGLVAQALCRLAEVQVKQKQLAEARQTIERLKTEYPEQKDLIAKAQGAIGGSVTEAVVEHKHTATAAEKAEATVLLAQGWNLMQDRKFEEAERVFRQAYNKDETSAAASALGWARLNQNGQDGEGEFHTALELDPKNAAALNGLGWVCKGKGNLQEAARYWQRAVEVDASATAAMSGLAQYAMGQGLVDEAVGWYEKWLKVDPQNADATIGINAARGMQNVVKVVTARVNDFLQKLDDAQYAESWSFMDGRSPLARSGDQGWEEIMKNQRSPLGKVVARMLDKSQVSASRGGGGQGTAPFGAAGFGAAGAGGGRGGRGGGRGGGGFGNQFGPGGYSAQDASNASFQFITQFDHKKDVYEYVDAVKDGNGEWRIYGYQIQTPQLGVDPLKAR